MTFSDILKHFKENEGEFAESILPLVEDKELRSGLLAWQSVLVEYNKDAECPYEDEKRKWLWMWKNIKFSQENYFRLLSVPTFEAPAVLEKLKAFRLIYPDGTSNTLARNYIRQMVKSKLPKSKTSKDKSKE